MARELGMNPRRLGGKANHRQEPWKAPLPIFIENLSQKRFGKDRPDRVVSIEARARELAAKKAAQRERRRARRLSVADSPETVPPPDQRRVTNGEQLGHQPANGRAQVEVRLI